MDDDQQANKKAPYKRRSTDRRREQNRTAQKIYRAKRKERLEQLERQVGISQGQQSRIGSSLQTAPLNDADVDATNTTNESASSPPRNSNMAALKALLNADDEKDADSLLQYALHEQLDVSKILLAGLRSLKAEKDGSSIAPLTRKGVDWRPDLWAMPAVEFYKAIMPDPFMNGILLRQQAPLEVYYHNCRKIGLQFEEMTKPTCRSPWFSPLNGPGLDRFPLEGVPLDLYPTPAQRNIMHHPFWDTIPFPWIRERAITLAALVPPPYEWHELKLDILNGGMVCWRSRGSEEGLPWDRRSWEFRPWFRQKWGWIIEEQGRVEQQSRWWRGMAGHEV
ncbi:hypothetical protein P280DRAFT_548118 [Massarina eburnea CBS 473.64]|uniref:BZIP domain-containing protein n=1 Tax=Massarina eburnea CBS 473.64 TaxID=1395130 RepID=A0A6A6S7G4_9PLEO|nr:hypothetical protein P280DRAFT_548118 [Massarina eburnea CBS 473.64]